MTETWFACPVNELDALIIARHRYGGAWGEPAKVYARWVTLAIARGTYVSWLAEAGSEVVGRAGLVLLDWRPTGADPKPIWGRVANVYTKPSWRCRGLARVLVRHCIDECEVRGIGVMNPSATPEARALKMVCPKVTFLGVKQERTSFLPGALWRAGGLISRVHLGVRSLSETSVHDGLAGSSSATTKVV